MALVYIPEVLTDLSFDTYITIYNYYKGHMPNASFISKMPYLRHLACAIVMVYKYPKYNPKLNKIFSAEIPSLKEKCPKIRIGGPSY